MKRLLCKHKALTTLEMMCPAGTNKYPPVNEVFMYFGRNRSGFAIHSGLTATPKYIFQLTIPYGIFP